MLKNNNSNIRHILGLMVMVTCLAIASVLLQSTLLIVSGPAAVIDELNPSPNSMDFYGYIQGGRAGDEITVYDKTGTLCGQFTLTKDGQYGFLHVYGDDVSTKVDEGAVKNEPLTFELNGSPLVPASGGEVYWLGDGKRERLDFIGK